MSYLTRERRLEIIARVSAAKVAEALDAGNAKLAESRRAFYASMADIVAKGKAHPWATAGLPPADIPAPAAPQPAARELFERS